MRITQLSCVRKWNIVALNRLFGKHTAILLQNKTYHITQQKMIHHY